MLYSILITLASLLLSIRTSKNLFAPATIISALWLFCILAYNIYPHNLIPLKDQFYTSISIWVGIFTLSALLTQSIYQKPKHNNDSNINVRNLYVVITFITFPYMLWSVINTLKEFGLLNDIFINLRSVATGNIKGLEEGTAKNYFAPLWLIAYALELLHYKKERLWILIRI